MNTTYRSITTIITTTSTPKKGEYTMFGDWPHKIAKVEPLGNNRYKVTYIRRQ